VKLHLEDEDVQAIARAVAALLRPSEPKPLGSFAEPVRTLRRAIRSGELQASKAGRNYYATDEAVAAWRAARRVDCSAKARPNVSRPAKQLTAAERAIERARAAGGLRAIAGGNK